MYVLTMNLPAEKIAEYHFSTKVLRAINRRPALINHILAKSSPITVHDTASKEVIETAVVEVESERLERVLNQVALGLYWHHFKQRWSGPFRVHPEFLHFIREDNTPESNTALEQLSKYADDLFRNTIYHGESQNVFKYQVEPPDRRLQAAMRMHFYGGVKVLTLFGNASD